MSSDAWATHYATPAGLRLWPCEELVRAVSARQQALKEETIGAVLEVGCGNGGNLWFLGEHASRLVGLDSSPEALKLCFQHMNRRTTGEFELHPGRIEQLPFEQNSFDAVVDCMVSQHVLWNEHPAVYAEYRRVLRPGGWLFLYHLTVGTSTGPDSVPGEGGLFDWQRLGLFPDAGPVCLPGLAALGFVVEEAGFGNVHVGSVERLYSTPLRDRPRRFAKYAVATGEAR